MEFRTARSYYNTFYMILLGILIGVWVGSFTGRVHWYLLLILSGCLLLPYMFSMVYISIDIVDEQLVLKSKNFFRQNATIFNIKDVELELYYTSPAPKRRAYYAMHIIKEGKVLHRIEDDVSELSIFINHFRRLKLTV